MVKGGRMSQVTIYKDADVALTVVDGTPPADQTAQVIRLQTLLQDMTADRDRLRAQLVKAGPLLVELELALA
jgi:hypothetical protein